MAQPAVFPMKATLDEYFELLSQPDSPKLNFYDGVIVSPEAMSGGGPNHSRVISGVNTALVLALQGKPCTLFTESTMVRCEVNKANQFPDLSIACQEPEFGTNRGFGYLVNPVVIIEVLSPSTEANDRGRKFANYQSIESFQNYVLISSENKRVEVFSRVHDGWHLTIYTDSAEEVEIPSIDINLTMNDIYRHFQDELQEKELPA